MKCFYHKDNDGLCSAAVVAYKFLKMTSVDFLPITYGEPFPWELVSNPKERVFMVDFSLKPDDMVNLNSICDLVWIDHHKTAIENMGETAAEIPGLRRVGDAGCELAWQYLFPDQDTPVFIKLLGRYDVWDQRDPDKWERDILPFQMGIRTFSQEDLDPASKSGVWAQLFIEAELYRYGLLDQIRLAGDAVMRYQRQVNREQLKAGHFVIEDFHGLRILAMNSQTFNSGLFDSMFDDSYDAMLAFAWRGELNAWRVGLYAVKDTPIAEIAEQYGGGGHARACGFTCPELPFELTGKGDDV